MPINIYNISNYDEIILRENSLLIFDIDETIFKFKNIDYQWWIDNIEIYTNLGYNYEDANDIVYNEWIEHIQKNDPILLDKDKLFNLFDKIKKSNSHLIMLSARIESTRDLTHNNLQHCGIKIEDYNLYLSKEKGDMINKLLSNEYKNYKNIIFLDDLEKNILDVKNKLSSFQYQLDLYHLKHINLL